MVANIGDTDLLQIYFVRNSTIMSLGVNVVNMAPYPVFSRFFFFVLTCATNISLHKKPFAKTRMMSTTIT